MDWSPEQVLDFRPVTHRRGARWQKRTNLLWPVRAWRVVVPDVIDRSLDPLQRAVLRFHDAGVREHTRAASLLGVDAELVALVTMELAQTGRIDATGSLTPRARKALELGELEVGDMRVGWVFQDTYSGRLMPRFVGRLAHADVEADDAGRAFIRRGTKGEPRRDWAFVVRRGDAPAEVPRPAEVIEAARRHRRHERRLARAKVHIDAVPAEVVKRVSLISDEPFDALLLTFVYVPERADDEDLPWYVADPFGFGASVSLREQIEQQRLASDGKLRDVLDRLTGEHLTAQRENWLAMQDLLRQEGRERVERLWPLSVDARDETLRELLALAFADLTRLEHEKTAGRRIDDRMDGPYLKLRQVLEGAARLLREAHAPGDAWRKLFRSNGSWLPQDAARATVTAHAATLGFETPTPVAIARAKPNAVKGMCLRDDASNLRPLCAALLLCATDHEGHPLHRLAAVSPRWFHDVDRIATAAGDLVHGGRTRRSLDELKADAEVVVRLCRDVAGVLGALAQRGLDHGT